MSRRARVLAVAALIVIASACTPTQQALFIWQANGANNAELAQAERVIACESGGDPNASNGGRYLGLFQLWTGDLPTLAPGQPTHALFNPLVNADVAWQLYRGSGWGPWACRP